MSRPTTSIQDSRDPIRKSRINELFEQLMPVCYADAEVLVKNPITEKVAGQLYYAAGSIGANHSEGYSRASGKTALATPNTPWDLCARACPGMRLLFRCSVRRRWESVWMFWRKCGESLPQSSRESAGEPSANRARHYAPVRV